MGMRKYNFELLKIFLKKLQAYVEYQDLSCYKNS